MPFLDDYSPSLKMFPSKVGIGTAWNKVQLNAHDHKDTWFHTTKHTQNYKKQNQQQRKKKMKKDQISHPRWLMKSIKIVLLKIGLQSIETRLF